MRGWWRVFRPSLLPFPVYLDWWQIRETKHARFGMEVATYTRTWRVLYVFGVRLAAWRCD